ncbi:MAG: penicillin acylase family protein, partial [Chitinophagaceae bacterium]
RSVMNDTSLLPVEFKLLGIKPGLWTPSVVISRHQGIRSNVEQELNLGRAVSKVGVKKVKELMWFHPKQPDLTIDPSIQTNLLFDDILAPYLAVSKELEFKKDHIHKEKAPEGSNNWIISGSKTESGMPILANDPHRKISNPSLRYIVHLVAPGWDVIGGGEPTIPGVSIGHNAFGAWGLTIFETDAEDLYVYDLNPKNQLQYRYANGWKTMTSTKEIIKVKNKKDTTVTLYYTQHGPVTYIDKKHNKAYAVRCAWLEPGGAPYLASLRMDQSKTWDEFRDACSFNHIPGENMIWADKKGNIGWQAVGITPIRTTHSGMVPVPGNGKFEWNGFLPIKERPHLLNPSKGFWSTANQHVTPNDYPRIETIGYTWADDFRGDRINEVLEGNKKNTIDESIALQSDYTSLPARAWVPMITGLRFQDPLTEKAKNMLNDWDLKMDKNSIPAGIYAMFEREVIAEAKKKFIPAEISDYINLQMTTLISWMYKPELIFGENAMDKKEVFLRNCFNAAIKKLKTNLGEDISQWQYGQPKFKHVWIRHPLSSLVNDSLKNILDAGPVARGGYGLTTAVTGNTDNQTFGASFRIVVDVADWDKAVMTNTPGQSGDPSSPFYKNLFELWASNQYFPAYYSRKKILNNAFSKTQMKPLPKK